MVTRNHSTTQEHGIRHLNILIKMRYSELFSFLCKFYDIYFLLMPEGAFTSLIMIIMALSSSIYAFVLIVDYLMMMMMRTWKVFRVLGYVKVA